MVQERRTSGGKVQRGKENGSLVGPKPKQIEELYCELVFYAYNRVEKFVNMPNTMTSEYA